MSLLQWNSIQVELFKKHKLTSNEILEISYKLQPLRNKVYNEDTRELLDRLILIERELVIFGHENNRRNY